MKYPTFLTRPATQNFVCAIVLFACPGLYGAITGLGAGGGQTSSTHVADVSNSTLYGLYTITALFAGSFLNIIGPRIALSVGAFGYAVYAAGLWYYDRTGNQAFPIAGGAVLGVCAGLLWTTACYITLAYPEEKDKGIYIAIQWMMVALGSTVGAIIAFALTKDEQVAEGVPTSVYAVFVTIMLVSVIVAAVFIIDPKDIRRADNSRVSPFKHDNWLQELKGIVMLYKDWKVLILIPSFFASMLCLAVQSGINAFYFDLRTRGVANVAFWAVQMPCAYALTLILDNEKFERRVRGIMGITITVTIALAGWICQSVWVNQNVQIDRNADGPAVDYMDKTYFNLPFAIYVLFGVVYATWQICCQWLIASYTNNPQVLARYAGLFHATVAAGECISFGVDAVLTPFKSEIIAYFTVTAIGGVILFVMCWTKTLPTSYVMKEDNVVIPAHIHISDDIIEGKDVEEVKTKVDDLEKAA